MELRVCLKCGNKYGYVDSPPAEKCTCGGVLKELDQTNTRLDLYGKPIIWDTEFPTVSC